jgi:hypothetical protein
LGFSLPLPVGVGVGAGPSDGVSQASPPINSTTQTTIDNARIRSLPPLMISPDRTETGRFNLRECSSRFGSRRHCDVAAF